MDALTAKGCSLVILFFASMLPAILAIWLFSRGFLSATHSPRRRLILDLFNCFSGGVFLSTCLLHLLVEGREELETYMAHVGYEGEYPFYELGVAVGIFLVAAVEKIGFSMMARFHRRKTPCHASFVSALSSHVKDDADDKPAPHSNTDENDESSLDDVDRLPPPVLTFTSPSGTELPEPHGKGLIKGALKNASTTATPTAGVSATNVSSSNNYNQNAASLCCPSGSVDNASFVGSVSEMGLDPTVRFASSQNVMRHEYSRIELDCSHHRIDLVSSTISEDEKDLSLLRAFMLLVALSFHTIFDGLAIGLQTSEGDVFAVLVAIMIHKALVAFCLGLELAIASSVSSRRPLVFMTVFAFISPVGVAVGMGITSQEVDEVARSLASSLLQAVATGTFIYVTFFEILGPHFAHHHHHHSEQHRQHKSGNLRVKFDAPEPAAFSKEHGEGQGQSSGEGQGPPHISTDSERARKISKGVGLLLKVHPENYVEEDEGQKGQGQGEGASPSSNRTDNNNIDSNNSNSSNNRRSQNRRRNRDSNENNPQGGLVQTTSVDNETSDYPCHSSHSYISQGMTPHHGHTHGHGEWNTGVELLKIVVAALGFSVMACVKLLDAD